MSHFAKVLNGKVVEVLAAEQSFIDNYTDKTPGTWIQTSFNTHGGVHTKGGVPLRKNFAAVGYSYDADLDAFIPPKPYESWILNVQTGFWEPPVPLPVSPDGGPMSITWDEATLSWVPITPNPPAPAFDYASVAVGPVTQ